MKNLTRGLHLNIERRILSLYIINSLLMTGILLIAILRLLLWPVRMLNKGLGMSGRWMLAQYR